jgi:choline-sulfatase
VEPKNLLFIMADEHARSVLGCYGNPAVRTPNLDRLAARGTRFTNAYTPSPVCVSARASLATGRWVHQTGCWSSAEPYDGAIPGWGHRLAAAGHRVASVGKLHYRRAGDPNGFDPELLPLHVVGGRGWVKGLLRDPLPDYGDSARQFAEQVGVGETGYTLYDRRVCETAGAWLRENGGSRDKPWVLFVSFVSPHYPLIAPKPFYDLHDYAAIGPPHRPDEVPDHPVLKAIYRFYNYRDHFTEARLREARLGYYGLAALVDHLVGELLGTLDALGLAADTRVVYTSDHGEMLGNHGMWTKMLMHEDSAAIPLIMSGPGVPAGRVVATPVSLVDCYPTIVEGAGLAPQEAEAALPGRNLVAIAGGAEPDRAVLSEFHDGGTPTGYFMVRKAEWKYVHYAGSQPQLFNLASDPLEDEDLGESAAHAGVRADYEALLRDILDPEEVNRRAFADQARKIAALGGREAILANAAEDFGFTPLSDIAGDLDLASHGELRA